MKVLDIPFWWAGPQRLWLKRQLGLRSYTDCQEHILSCPLKQCRVPVEAAQTLTKRMDEVPPHWQDMLRCRLIVGLHPDQATGGVIELARELGRPFAVVPCCTFADQFPERCLTQGPVRTYADLVEWLQLVGGPNTQKDFLRFFGKNLVLFSAQSTSCEVASSHTEPDVSRG